MDGRMDDRRRLRTALNCGLRAEKNTGAAPSHHLRWCRLWLGAPPNAEAGAHMSQTWRVAQIRVVIL